MTTWAGYAVENQPVVLKGVTELLVHGVGGEPAEDTLHEPHPRQVAGDATAGFYCGSLSRSFAGWPARTGTGPSRRARPGRRPGGGRLPSRVCP